MKHQKIAKTRRIKAVVQNMPIKGIMKINLVPKVLLIIENQKIEAVEAKDVCVCVCVFLFRAMPHGIWKFPG